MCYGVLAIMDLVMLVRAGQEVLLFQSSWPKVSETSVTLDLIERRLLVLCLERSVQAFANISSHAEMFSSNTLVIVKSS